MQAIALKLQRHTAARSRAGFTLVELALVIAIAGVIGALAIPRMSIAADNARIAQTDRQPARPLQDAVDYYTAEHGDRSPATNPDGSLTASGTLFLKRLTDKTDELGNLDPMGIFGPYIRNPPKNPFNDMVSLRIDGAAVASGATAWRFDSDAGTVKPDDTGAGTRKTRLNPEGAAAAEALEAN